MIDTSGKYHKDILVRAWKLREERELGTLVKHQQSARFGQYVAIVLAHMCTQLGHHDFGSKVVKDKIVNKKLLSERLAIVNDMYMGDVLFAYLWLRVQSMGTELPIQLSCPRCREKIPFKADLDSLEVRSVDRVEDSEWRYKLATPIEIRNQEIVDLLIRPPRWSALKSAGSDGGNFGELKASMIHSSVYAAGDMEPLPLAPHEFDELTKLDFETLTADIDAQSVGPDLMVELDCSACSRQIRTSIEWASEDFFGVSSRSTAMRS